MNKGILLAIGVAIAGAGTAIGQTAIDAYTVSPTQLRGSARFVSMGGAFTSLGGDLTCMTQNPAGLGLYRTSDIGLTFDISIRNYGAQTSVGKYTKDQTKVYFDNFGYVGVNNIYGSALKSFQWGVGYNRLATFDRIVNGYNNPAQGSLTNYIASNTNGVPSNSLLATDDFDPYLDGGEDWLSILGYNSFMINETGDDRYAGLRNNLTEGDALYSIREKGYVDEYNIDFAGNVEDVFFWGLGVGIVDMNYTRYATYSESMSNADVYDTETDRITSGNAGYNLYNNKYISGSGANLKIGFIVRPVEMLRLGFAIHTPTWLHMTHNGFADTDYNYTPNPDSPDAKTTSGDFSTPEYSYDSRLNTPWRFMVGASAILGGNAILSADYERVAYNDMRVKSQNYGMFGGGFETDDAVTDDVKQMFRAANIFRVGLEYRLTRNFSARAGYNYQSSAVTTRTENGQIEVPTAGTDPSYNLNKATNNFSLGLGYRSGGWYVDLAYQYSRQKGTFHAFTSTPGNFAPSATVTDTHNNIVISTGFRF